MSEKKRVDFHVHYRPEQIETAYEVIEKASRVGVVVMSLVARGEISDQYDCIIEYAAERGVILVTGTEYLSFLHGGEAVELILLNFDLHDYGIGCLLGTEENRPRNAQLAKKQKSFMESKGFTFDFLEGEDFELLDSLLSGDITEKAIKFCELAVRNPMNSELARYLKSENNSIWCGANENYGRRPNYMNRPDRLTAKFLWLLYFEVGKEGFFPVQYFLDEVVDIVHGAGGVVLYSPEGEFRESTWNELINCGVDGVMGWHADRLGLNKGINDIPLDVIVSAKKNGLLVLGGSDYQQQDWDVGEGNGKMFISPRRYGDLVEYLKLKSVI